MFGLYKSSVLFFMRFFVGCIFFLSLPKVFKAGAIWSLVFVGLVWCS